MSDVRLSRQRFLRSSVLGLAALAVAACSQQSAPSSSTSAPTASAPATAPTASAGSTPQPAASGNAATAKAATITIWPRGATDQAVFEKIDAGFKTKHPEITVTLQPLPDNGYEKFLAAAAANSGPDSLVINMPAGVPMIYKGAFLSLQSYLMESTDVQDNLKKFVKPALDAYTVKEQLYAIPVTNESQVIFYNADLLDKAGLQHPEEIEDDPQKWNWDTLVEYSKKLNEGTGFDRPQYGIRMLEPDVQGGWGNWVYSRGGAYLNADGTKCVLDLPESNAALQWILDFRFKLDVSPGPEQLSAAQQTRISFFQNQKVAIEPDGEYFRRYLYGPSAPKDGLKFTFGITQYPFAPDGKRAQMFHTLGLPINKASKNPDAMWAYLSNFSTKDAQQFITDLWGSRGAHTDTYQSFVAGGDKPKANWAAIVKADAYGVPLPISPYLSWNELYDPFTRVFGDLVMQGKLDPAKGITQIVSEVQAEIAKNQAAG